MQAAFSSVAREVEGPSRLLFSSGVCLSRVASTRKYSALRAAKIGEEAGRHVFFGKFGLVKASY